jgi:nucleoside-diphosphate-sugar epimerase
MRLLILGGTAWLGSAIAAVALSHDHEVTCLARGRSGEVPEGARLVRADRELPDAYTEVAQQRWDAVIDVARQPGQVRRAAAALEPIAALYIFVSSANVYADQRTVDQDEDAPLLPALEQDHMADLAQYGEAKVACERAVAAAFGSGRSLLVRAGLLGGPGDLFGRSGYWPWRFAHPSNLEQAVLVPDAADRSIQLLDTRDLAAWLVSCAESGTVTGVRNAVGLQTTFGEHLDVARRVADHAGPVIAVPESWLRDRGVQPWMGPASLALWLDDPSWLGMNARNGSRAVASGLTIRPLDETLRDVRAWEVSRAQSGPHGAGLTDSEERSLLAAYLGRRLAARY